MNMRNIQAAEIAGLVEKAESAVKEIRDPELKKIAFSRVLDSLLATDPRPRTNPRSESRNKPQGGPTKRAPRDGPSAYLEDLVSDGFFAKQVSLADVRQELSNRGHHIPATSLSGPLQTLCKKKALRRQKSLVDGREAFVYSNW